MYAVVKQFGTGGGHPIYRFFCPMAFNNTGAYWLQANKELENPYWGAMMFTCGEMAEIIIAEPEARTGGEHRHD
jgi:hypothetical protein